MTYPELNGTQIGTDLGQLFVYANTVTHSWFGLIMTLSFFLVVFMGSIFAQMRFSGRVRVETSFLASSFVTLGFATILEQTSGILSPIYFYIIVIMNILGILLVKFSSD
jgi:hypothetical protein